jgi:hypothetical protein
VAKTNKEIPSEVALFDKADVTAAFEPRSFYLGQVLGFCFEPHIFFEMMFRNVVPEHVLRCGLPFCRSSAGVPFTMNPKACES